jgi:hypothetical protein
MRAISGLPGRPPSLPFRRLARFFLALIIPLFLRLFIAFVFIGL